jgi:hypothetical protein
VVAATVVVEATKHLDGTIEQASDLERDPGDHRA